MLSRWLERWWKLLLVLGIMAWSLYEIYPTMVWYSLPEIDRIEFKTDEIRALEAQMAVLETERQAAESTERQGELSGQITDLSKQIDDLRSELKVKQQRSIPLGLDLKGGVHVVLKVDTSAAKEDYEKETLLQQVIENLRNRIDNLGVREPLIQRQGEERILVQIPSITDPAEVLQVIGKTAQLQFRFAKENEGDYRETYEVINRIDEALPSAVLIDKVQFSGQIWTPPWIYKEDFNYFQEHLFVKDADGRYTTELKEEVKALCPNRYTLMFGNPEEQEVDEGKTIVRRNLYLVEDGSPQLTGNHLADASVQLDSTRAGEPYVAFALDPEGAKIFSRITGNHVGDALAIVLDGTIYSAPRIVDKIAGGHGQITGSFDVDEAKLLAVVLRSGALPASVSIEESRIIDPTLGKDSVDSGVKAGLLGALLVVLFMVAYYSASGVVAILALILNILILVACLAFIPATLTLPGIAGIVLMVGMAVDANVLIFERMREEQAGRTDRALALIVDRGFGRAFWTIFDSNLTTLITAVVLFQFGTGPVKGFAVTLSLGIIISMFTAIFVGRMIFDILTERLGVKNLHLGAIRLFANAKFPFLSVQKIMITTSIIVIVIGLAYTFGTLDNNLGVDLTSGSSVRMKFNQPVDEGLIRDALQKANVQNATVFKFASDPDEAVVRTKVISLPEGVSSMGAYVGGIVKQALPQFEPQILSDDSVGPTVGGELIGKAIWALVASAFFIVIYIAIRFQLAFSIAAVAALFHDVLITLGLFCLTNIIPGQHHEINLPIIAALLTIVGYSLNDTIVVFDRIRENRRTGRGLFSEVVNASINQTLSRTIITSGTTLLVVFTLFLFGGAAISDFAFTLLIGIVVGTYSSIFIASPILVWWHDRVSSKKKAAVKW